MPTRGKRPNAAKAAEAAEAAEATEATEATEVSQAITPYTSVSTDDETEEGRAEVQPGQELEAGAPEGGGEQDAPVNEGSVSNSGFHINEDTAGNVQQVTFFREEGNVVMERPADGSDEMLMWQLFETTRFRGKKKRAMLQSAINKAHAALSPLVVAPNTNPGMAMATLAHAGEYPSVVPREFRTKSLSESVVKQLEVYYLQIDEKVKDRHGNPYVPALRPGRGGKMCWRGSMLGGKFPHSIVSVKDPGEGVRSRTSEFMCADNNLKMRVSIKRKTNSDSVAASEHEVLALISESFSAQQRSSWCDLENKMVLYCFMEFADGEHEGEVVGAHAFENPPDYGGIFKPAESPPSYLNQDEGVGYYEYNMLGGSAEITFGFADRVTNANLKPAYKRQRFRMVVKGINFYVAGLVGFTARSSPFMIKGVLHNDVKSNERYVTNASGVVVDSAVPDMPQ